VVKNTFGNAGEKYEVVQPLENKADSALELNHGRDGRELKQIVVAKTRNVDDTDMMPQVVGSLEYDADAGFLKALLT
jgi:hypothetical protein